jgi:hypothetical protein
MVGNSISLSEGRIVFYLTSMLAGKMSERYYMKLASFEFGVGGFGGSRAGVSPAQRTLEARSPSKMSHG